MEVFMIIIVPVKFGTRGTSSALGTCLIECGIDRVIPAVKEPVHLVGGEIVWQMKVIFIDVLSENVPFGLKPRSDKREWRRGGGYVPGDRVMVRSIESLIVNPPIL